MSLEVNPIQFLIEMSGVLREAIQDVEFSFEQCRRETGARDSLFVALLLLGSILGLRFAKIQFLYTISFQCLI